MLGLAWLSLVPGVEHFPASSFFFAHAPLHAGYLSQATVGSAGCGITECCSKSAFPMATGQKRTCMLVGLSDRLAML